MPYGGVLLGKPIRYERLLYNFKKYLPLLRNLAGKDFKIKYRRSVLGVAWSILNPLLTMLVLTAVFSMIFKVRDYPDIGDFAVYYIVGASIWNFFAEATSSSLYLDTRLGRSDKKGVYSEIHLSA